MSEAQESNNEQTVEQTVLPEINLENLRAGKFTTKDISKKEAERLWEEEYKTLPEGAKKVSDAVGWQSEPFVRGQKNRDGSPKKFKDWEEFAAEGREKMPILNERLNHIAKENAELKAQIANMTKLQRMQTEREIKKDKSSIDQEMQEAFDAGDRKKFAEAQERKAQIESEEKILKEFEPRQAKPAPILAPEVILFKANNPWFEQDRVLTLYARQLDSDLAREYPDISLSQRFQMVEDDIKTNPDFAHKFNKSDNPTPPSVESAKNSGRLQLNQVGEMSFERLPEEEQNRVERMVKIGIVKSKTEFMKEYNQKRKVK